MAEAKERRKKEMKCGDCKEPITKGNLYVYCEFCDIRFHLECVSFTDKDYITYSSKMELCFICMECKDDKALKQFKELRNQHSTALELINKIDSTTQYQNKDIERISQETNLMLEKITATKKILREFQQATTSEIKELRETLHRLEAREIATDLSSVVKLVKELKNAVEAKGDHAVAGVPSYASVVRNAGPPRPTCIIRPRENAQNSESTRDAVLREINPRSLGVFGMTEVRGGAVRFRCQTDEVLNEVRGIVESRLSDGYELEIPGPELPRVKLSGLTERLNETEIRDCLVRQNDLNIDVDEVKIITVRDTRRGRFFDVVISTPVHIYNELMKRSRINIGWDRCYVADGMHVRRCMNCCSYGHLRRDCTESRKYCLKCSGNHDVKDCESDEKCCINCFRNNQSFSQNYDVNHSANSIECPTYKKTILNLKEKIFGEL
ncbi:uncharacterized protein DMENIID0001_113650 [Sergentomyia squamirostris]